jgi:hypothetical protein
MKEFSRLPIMKVGCIINRKDRKSIINWLDENQIKIHKDTRKYVYKVEVDLYNIKPLAMEYKSKYPNDWKQRISVICGGENELFNLLLLEIGSEPTPYPTTRVKPTSAFQKDIIKRLLQ